MGRPLVKQLIEAGHTVTAMTRSPDRARALSDLGAAAVVCDVFDPPALRDAVRLAAPDAVINHLTDLPPTMDLRSLGDYYAANDRIRLEGNENLLGAALAAGVNQYVAQSVAFFYAPLGESVKTEDAPLWRDGPPPFGDAVAAIQSMEHRVQTQYPGGGVVLRFGFFYGPGTWYAADGAAATLARKRQNPVLGSGEGVASFIHVDDAAGATVAALAVAPGVYNVADDQPAAQKDWLPVFCDAVQAPKPTRMPAWVAEVIVGKPLVTWMTTLRGASNSRFKAASGWQPRHASWREGFLKGLAQAE